MSPSYQDGLMLFAAAALRLLFPSWAIWLATASLFPSLLKFWVPLIRTVLLLHTNPQQQQPEDKEVAYWLNYWVINASLSALLLLVSQMITWHLYPTFHSIFCQLELLFYLWIHCSQQPDLLFTLPTALFLPLVAPLFETVSRAIPSSTWKDKVISKVKYGLHLLVLLQILTEVQSNAIQHGLERAYTVVIPAATILCPGCITQFGVLYIQYIVPIAMSFKALHQNKPKRYPQRILYLKFWVIHGLLTGLLNRLFTLFWWLPLANHVLLLLWSCIVVSPNQVVPILYREFNRELKAFGLLPRLQVQATTTASTRADYDRYKKTDDYETDNHSVVPPIQQTHTARVLSFLLRALPSAMEEEDATTTRREELQHKDTTTNEDGFVQDETLMDGDPKEDCDDDSSLESLNSPSSSRHGSNFSCSSSAGSKISAAPDTASFLWYAKANTSMSKPDTTPAVVLYGGATYPNHDPQSNTVNVRQVSQ